MTSAWQSDPEKPDLWGSLSSQSAKSPHIPSSELMDPTQRRKKFGQVFTPPALAALMADWVMSARPSRVLDPAFGRGALATACLSRDPSVQLFGFEIDPVVLQEMPRQLRKTTTIKLEDFLKSPSRELFDGIIANPPYIRHRELEGHLDQRKGLARASGCEIPKSANQYVDFLVKATLHLSLGGRAAFLIPAEWMSANFSVGLKEYLLDRHFIKRLITFSNCSNVFSDALTTASLVLLEKSNARTDKILTHYLQSIDSANAPQSLDQLDSEYEPRELSPTALRNAPKWEPLLRGDQSTVPEGWIPLGELASTRRGIATGANDFFLISNSSRVAAQIDSSHILPCVGRSNDVPGLIFSETDFVAMDHRGTKNWLLNLSSKLSPSEQAYVNEGEQNKIHERYLTKVRRPWFTMEQRDPAPIWAGVFGRGDLRFVLNSAMVRSLTNFHCIYPTFKEQVFLRALVAVLNSIPVRELMVRHQRGYGGGLMKFEPKDLLAIPIPDLRTVPQETVEELARQLPAMHARQLAGVEPSTEKVNELVLSKAHLTANNDFRLFG